MEKNGVSKMTVIAILSISLLTIMAPTAVSPALGGLSKQFPEVSQTVLKLVLTLPTLLMMPVGALSAKLAEKIGKKQLLLVGMTLFLVFGVWGGFVNSFPTLLFMRGLFGVGLSIMAPLSTSLLFDFEPDSGRRNKLMGIQGATNQLGGLVFTSLAGTLANISWRHSFLCYTFVLLSMVLTIFFLPKMEPAKQEEKKTDGKLDIKLFILAFFSMMIFACFFVVNTDLSIFMQEEGLGDAQACGNALSIMRIPAIIAGICLAKLMKKLKDFTAPLATLFMALGYVIIACSHSYATVLAGCLTVGIGGGVSLPPLTLMVPRIVPPSKRTMAVALTTSISQLGQFFSPIFTGFFVREDAPDALRMRFIVAAVATVITGICVLVFSRTISKEHLSD